MYATGLYIDGNRVTRVQINTNNHTSISQMVEGDFDVVSCVSVHGEQFSVFVNDLGFYSNMELNLIASVLAGRYLVGPAVVTGVSRSGETISVPACVIHKAAEIVDAMGLHEAFSTVEQTQH